MFEILKLLFYGVFFITSFTYHVTTVFFRSVALWGILQLLTLSKRIDRLLGRTEKSVEEGSPDKQSPKTKEKNKSKRGKPRQTLKNQHEEPSFSTSLSTPIEEIIEESLTEEASADIIPPTGTKKKHKSRKPHPNKSEDIDWPVDEDEITKKAVKVQKEVEADDVGFSFPPVREKGKRNKDKKIAKKKTDILDPSVPQDFFVFVKDKPPKPGIVNNYQTRKAKQAVIETVPDRARRFSDSFEKVQFQAVGNRIEEKCQPENLVKPEHKESKKVSPQVSYASVLTNSTIECDEEKVSNINSTELIELQLKLSTYSNSTESCSGSNFSSIEVLNKITPSACESPEEIESQFEVIKANDLVSSDPNCIFITEEASTEILKDSPVCANDEEAVKKTEKVPVSDSLESESNEIQDLPELDISSEELRDLTAAEGDLEPETHPVDFDLLQHRESDKTNLDKEVSVPNGTEKFLEVEVTSGNEPSTANNHQGNSDLLEELDRIDLDEVAHISKNKEQVLEINPTSGEEAKFISSGEVDSSSDNNFFDFDQSASNTNSDLAEFAQAIEESLGVQKKGSILHNTANSSKQESLLEFIELEKQLSEFDKEIVFVSEPTTKTQQNQDLSQSIPSTVESDQNSSVGSCQFKSPLEHSSFSEKSADQFVFPDYSNSGTFSGPEFTPPELFKDILPDILTNSLVTKDQAEDLDKLNESAALSEIRRNTPLELIKDFQQSPTSYQIADSSIAVSQTSGISSEEFQPNPADTSSFGSDRIEGEILCADSRPQSGAFSSEDSETNIRVITSRFIEEERFVRKYSYWTGSCEQLELLATPIRENKKLTSETMQQVRVLTLNDLEHQESTLYRIKKEWIIEFRVGPSLFGRKVFLYCNYPFEKAGKTAEFNRNKYQLLEWAWDEGCENADDTAAFIQIKAALAGSFHYFFTYEKGENFERHGSGYFLVDPVLTYGRNEDLPLDCIQCQTVLTKGLGSFSKWESKLRVAKESGYNMIHFTPIQELGESNSSYSLSEQLQLNPIFKKDDGEMPTFEDVEKLVSKLREEWKITSICDIVLNHTANESKWIQAHPEVTYNCVDCPYMRPAYLLDAALHQFSMDVKKGLYEDRGVPSEVDSEEHLNAIRHHLQQSVLEPLNIPELYMIDVNKCVAKFLMLARTVTPAAQNRGEVTEELELVQDPEYRRLAASVDMDLALKLYNVYWNDTFDEESRLKRCSEELKKQLDSLNKTVTEEVNGDLNVALDNVIAGVRYHRVQPDGPRFKEITASNPLVYRYFTDFGTPKSLKEHEEIMYSDKGRFLMAHNGWVLKSDPLKNFAAKDSKVYIRRELIAWGDSVKLRFGDKPEDCPFLWDHMKKYVEQTARIFDGVRLDNCHSTPIPVAEYLLDCARRVRPDLYVVAELFTNSDMTDNIFVNRLGITSLIREAMSAWDSHEQGRLVYRYGGSPVGSFHQPSVRPLVPSVAHALFLDQTHDNPSPVEKRSAFDLLPSTALVNMACCASGSNRGFDELVPHHVHVVDETREYTEWREEGVEVGPGIVTERSGLIGAKRAINDLHFTLGKEGFNQVYVDQMDADIVAVTRHCPDTHQSYILVAFTAFNHPNEDAENHQRGIKPLRFEGVLEEIVLEASMSHVNKKSGGLQFSKWERFEKDSKYINGLSEYEVSMKQHINVTESDILEKVDSGTQNVTQLNFKNFKPGSVVVVRVSLPESMKNAVEKVRNLIDKFSLKEQTDLSAIISKMTLGDLNRALYRCDQEERDEGFGFDTYNIPNFGPMVYAGLQGFMSLLSNIRPSNDLGHPMCANLRDGNWMIDFIWKRLKLDPGTEELGHWIEENTKCFTDIPRYLVPCYFDMLVTGIYILLMEKCFNSMTNFVKNGSTFARGLSLGSVQFGAHIKSADLPTLSPNLAPPKPLTRKTDSGEVVQACVTLSAGLPHFSVGYMRNWGRDTFIALRGLFILTGRYQEAREHILGYAACLRHGLIPNLLDGGRNPRFNCRDAVWWWLHCIKEYVTEAPDGISILSDKVSRIFPKDDSAAQPPGAVDQPLHDVMQEALNVHFQGLAFRERNAGKQIDEHMTDQGFNNQIGVHPETGFIFGGNQWNCGTWMDKMGSSDKAGNRGKPATPRDGSAVELIGLSKSVISWLAKLDAEKKYPYPGVERTHKDGRITRWTFKEWSDKIQANFEKHFWINSKPTEGEIRPDLINKRGIYKDCHGASQEWTDFQLRCNFPVAMVAAPELFSPSHAWEALAQAEKYLLGPLGMKTLDPKDWAYRGDYNNSNDSNDPTVANGFNYHQGPEWVWPIGFFLRAKLIFAAQNGALKETLASAKLILSKHFVELQTSPWRGLPELTNTSGSYCSDSSRTQAWSMSCVLEVLYDLQKIESSLNLQGN
nr:glycogen debranching enzyme [Leptinotarsa decemlineata]